MYEDRQERFRVQVWPRLARMGVLVRPAILAGEVGVDEDEDRVVGAGAGAGAGAG